MTRFSIFILGLLILSSSCKKREFDDPVIPEVTETEEEEPTKKVLAHIGDLDASSLDCILWTQSANNDDYLFAMDDCKRIIRFDDDLNPKDWIGYDENGVLGVHGLQKEANYSGYIDLILADDEAVYFITQDSNWQNDSLRKFNWSSGETEVLDMQEEFGALRFRLDNGQYVVYTGQDNILKNYNPDFTLNFEYATDDFISFPHLLLETDGENVWILENVQASTPPRLVKYGPDGSELLSFDTDFGSSYIPSFEIKDDLLYVESYEQNKSKVFVYDLDGELVDEYAGDNSTRASLTHLVGNKNLGYNTLATGFVIHEFQ